MIVVGVLSGTSADGVDAAVADLQLAGDELLLTPLGHRTTPLPDDVAALLADVLPPAVGGDAGVWCRLDTRMGQVLADAADTLADAVGVRPELIASHGQTVYHWVVDGAVDGTLQVGQPAWVAEAARAPVISDLRAADVAAGGQGAPLAAAFDRLLLGHAPGRTAALNLGGIANVTVVDAGEVAVAFDTGPANALLDAVARERLGTSCDLDGAGAARGQVDAALLATLRDDAFFARPPPKSTGREQFHLGWVDQAATVAARGGVTTDDLLATLVELTATTVADACRAEGVTGVVVSGGGVHNPTLMGRLAGLLDGIALRRVDELGIDADAKEAYVFAVLGYLSACGVAAVEPTATGARGPRVLGSVTPANGLAALPLPVAPVRPGHLRIVVTGQREATRRM